MSISEPKNPDPPISIISGYSSELLLLLFEFEIDEEVDCVVDVLWYSLTFDDCCCDANALLTNGIEVVRYR